MCCFNGVLLLENESHQTALAIVEEEDQFADCFELVSTIVLPYMGNSYLVNHANKSHWPRKIWNSWCPWYIFVFRILMRKILANGLQFAKFTNFSPTKIFPCMVFANIHRYTKNVFGVCTDCSLFTKIFLTNSFTCMIRQNFTLPNISCVQYTR